MRLAELSAAERRYLNSPLAPVDALTPALVRHLQGVLGARMKQRVQISVTAAAPDVMQAPLVERAVPEIGWESGLEAMWLRARLGGRCDASTRCAALSANLLHTLQRALAETWLSLHGMDSLPALLTLRIALATADSGAQHATLVMHLPATQANMHQWAQRMIHHEN